ncbi:MAG: hypothetical protein LBV70_00340, partial [Candidatus Adiutrix sp.]|nr:hypothetical protein [Candidatus Adiutrix sp.]
MPAIFKYRHFIVGISFAVTTAFRFKNKRSLRFGPQNNEINIREAPAAETAPSLQAEAGPFRRFARQAQARLRRRSPHTSLTYRGLVMKRHFNSSLPRLGFALLLWLPLSSALAAATALAGQTITIDAGTPGSVCGNGAGPNGASPCDGDTNGNTVIINGPGVGGGVLGALSQTKDSSAANNSVTINGGQATYVYGGQAEHIRGNATVTGNRVTISNNSSAYTVWGGESYGSTSSVAADNSVFISDSTVSGGVYGAYASTSATGNSVSISGGTVKPVYGGYGYTAEGNSVNISGGTVTSVTGGYSTYGSAGNSVS